LPARSARPGPHASFEDEARAALAAADALLDRVGSDRSALLHVTVHIADLVMMPRFNAVWTGWLDGAPPPARVAVQTPMVDPTYSVAVSCVARILGARD
jgi:enamine deaminase RidA (YjgF/YER057c/UK114 family)